MKPTKKPVRPPALSTQIKDHLVHQMVAGDLRPGDRLVELKIANEMSTSQAPVREALKELEALGLVLFRRNRGATVRKMNAAELADVYAVRAELEGYAATLAAGRPRVGDRLLKLCAKMEEAPQKGASFVSLNTDFHKIIVDASENRTLVEIWEKLDVRTRTALNPAGQLKVSPDVLADHRKIAEAIQSGDAELARRRVVAHINAVVSAPDRGAHRPADKA